MARMFRDRAEAGQRLAGPVAALHLPDPVVLALPRGGVPVAVPVARRLNAPLDLLMVRKIGLPGNRELAAGAVVDGPVHQAVFNEGVLRAHGLNHGDFDVAVAQALQEIESRRAAYLAGRAAPDLTGRDVVVVDDGIATGATMRAALKGVRRQAPRSITLAVPVAPPDALGALEPMVDHLVCLERPVPFHAVGAHYQVFDQVGDAAVIAGLSALWDKEEGDDA